MNTTRGGGENRGVVDSQDRLVVVHAGVKQGLDHSESEFGVLGTSGSILGLFFCRIRRVILDKGTAKQSTMQKSKKQTPNERIQHEEGETSGASSSSRISSGRLLCSGHHAIERSNSNPGK